MYSYRHCDTKETFEDLVLKFHFSKGLICPNCECPDATKHGKYNNVQRYRCCACGRTFTYKSNTFISGTHNVEKWNKYIECFKKGMTIRQCAKEVGISIPTAFSWRHRLLSALKLEKPEKFVGNVEVLSKHFRKNEKGNKCLNRRPWPRGSFAIGQQYRNMLLIAIDQSGNRLSRVLDTGNYRFYDLSDNFFTVLKDTNRIVTNHSFELSHLAKKLNISEIVDDTESFYKITAKENTTIKSRGYLYDFYRWLEKFHGVATKNLEKYIKWYELIITKLQGNGVLIGCMV